MKKLLLLLPSVFYIFTLQAQNIGISTTEPLNRLHVIGSFFVNEPTTSTNTPPTAAQKKTMVNSSLVTFSATNSTGYIYDPGSPSGNYIANLTAFANLYAGSNVGFELNFTDMDLGIGDSVIIKEHSSSNYPPLFAVSNGYSTTSKIIIIEAGFFLIFKSNGDANVGMGFTLHFRQLYSTAGALSDLKGVSGNALYFDAKKSAFRTGLLNNSAVGAYFFGSGRRTAASGTNATAMGSATTASRGYSTAMGESTIASGAYATAMGYETPSSREISTAMGGGTIASGHSSNAMGFQTIASGDYSLAAGFRVSTNNKKGSFFFGDSDPNSKGVRPLGFANQFAARFNG